MKLVLEGKVTTVGLGAKQRTVVDEAAGEPRKTTEMYEVTVARVRLDQTVLKDPDGRVQWQVEDLLIAGADAAWLGQKVAVSIDVALPGEPA